MKKFDLVKLINDSNHKEKGLFNGIRGIVIEINNSDSEVLFLNNKILGEAIKVIVLNKDLEVEKAELPQVIKNEMVEKLKKSNLNIKEKFTKTNFKQYDLVELIVEDEKYTKFGIHIGYKGCVADDIIIKNFVLVDFSRVDDKGNYFGDCISVKVDDLKVIKD